MPSVHKSLSSPSQATPTSGSPEPSSVDGSQSLSAPSHRSTKGSAGSMQTIAPAVQTVFPSSQASISSPSQKTSTPISPDPSGVSGLQSLSSPSHVSATESIESSHVSSPATHTMKPPSQRSSSSPSQMLPRLCSSAPSGVDGSQSLSIPSHSSTLGSEVSAHRRVPPSQVHSPSAQRSASSPSHAVPTFGSWEPSAVSGLQSLSVPSHTSAMEPPSSMHFIVPSTQPMAPLKHRSSSSPSQAVPYSASEIPSSVDGSQSLSTESHNSAAPSVVSEQTRAPPTHSYTPSRQRSESSPSQSPPNSGSDAPSRVVALQSLSSPSQISRAGVGPSQSESDD